MGTGAANLELPSVGIEAKHPTITVIVVNYNGKRILADCLSSLARQNAVDFEVIVVDNGSTDGSDLDIPLHLPDARLIRLDRNLGYSAAVNRGIREAGGGYIFTLNNDTELHPDCIGELLSGTGVKGPVGMWATKMVFPDGAINSTGICISRSGAAWDRGMFQPDIGQFEKPGDVFGPCGGAALYRKDMLADIGYFDEDFFLYMEDVDIAFRGRLAGWTCRYVPSAVVVHHHGGTAGYNTDLTIYYGNRNILWYVVKDVPLKILILYFPWILCRNCGVIPYYFVKGNGKSILRAKIDAVLGIRTMIKKRRSIRVTVPLSVIKQWINPWAGRSKCKS